MGATPGRDFATLERAGWLARAARYDEFTGVLTGQAIDALLDAVGVRRGMRLLDVATGTGAIAAAAAARGAETIGVDFAPAMVGEASHRHPQARFEAGDAGALPFGDGEFDAVTCAFGMLHFADPDAAVRQAFRVLHAGGRYAFSVWADPSKARMLALVLHAIKAHGRLDVELPPAPPLFRFSDAGECRRVLAAQGFTDIEVRDLDITLRIEPARLGSFVIEGTVRAAMLIDAQAPAAREAILRAIETDAERYRVGPMLVIPQPAVLCSARKA